MPTGLPQGSPYAGKRFEDLNAIDQRRLRNAVLRAVNIRQLAPANQSTSMFHIFERLNTGGTPLRAQEIRNCVFHGALVGALNEANEHKGWREILGRKVLDKHQRDVEMVLRIFAMSDRGERYEKPMAEFLNQQMNLNKQDKSGKAQTFFELFRKTCDLVNKNLPVKPFHLRGPLNLAAMDSIMATLIRNSDQVPNDLAGRYQRLVEDDSYQQAIYYNTSDTAVVKERLKIAVKHLIR